MKRRFILGLIVVAVAMGIILSTAGDASTYVSFEEAQRMKQQGVEEKVHVVGTLPKNEQGQVIGMHYKPTVAPNYFTFQLKDEKGKIKRVVYNNPKPQDFEKSEKVVIVGRAKDSIFMASKILLKCPSKYQKEELKADIQ